MKKNKLRRIICAAIAAAMLLACLPSAALAENADFSLMAATPDTTYTIYAGSSMEFTNLSSSEQTANLSGSYFEYAVYYKDGSIKEYSAFVNNSSKSLTIPAEGKLIVGSYDAYSGVTCQIADDYFLTEEIDEPLYEHVCLSAGESRRFVNETDTEYNLFLGTASGLNVVFYDTAGNYVSNTGKTASFAVSAGYAVEMTSYRSCSEIAALSSVFTSEELDKPVYNSQYRITGESYYYKNNGSTSLTILWADTDFIYENYDATGTITDYGYASEDFAVDPGCSSKIYMLSPRQRELPDSAGLEYEKLDEPFVDIVSISVGDSLKVTNVSDTAHKLVGGGMMNYALYNAAGNVTASAINTSVNGFSIPAGYTLKFTAMPSGGGNGDSIAYILAFDDIFTAEETTQTYYDAVSLADGDYYIFRNVSSGSASLTFVGTTFYEDTKWEIYNSDGTLNKSGTGSCSTAVPAGGYAKVSFDQYYYNYYGSRYTSGRLIYFIANQFTVEKTSAPVAINTGDYANTDGYYTLEYRNTYKITNNGDADYSAALRELSAYLLYSESGTLVSSAPWSISTLTIPVGGYMYVMPRSNYGMAESSGVSFEKVNANTFSVAKIPTDGTYTFENTSSCDMTLYVELAFRAGYTSTDFFDYIIYNTDGSIKSSGQHLTGDGANGPGAAYSLTVPAGCTAALTASLNSAKSMTIPVTYATDFFAVGEKSDTTWCRKIIDAGEKIRIDNITGGDATIYLWNISNSGIDLPSTWDFKRYNADGSLKDSYHAESYSEKTYTVPANGSVVIDAATPFQMAYINECFSLGEGEAVYDYSHAAYGETLLLKNNDIYSQTIKLYTDGYGYVLYDDEENVKSTAIVSWDGTLTLAAGESAAIAPCGDSDLWAVTLSGTCDVSTRDYPPVLTQAVCPGETVTLTNKTRLRASVKVSSPDYSYVAYTIYISSGEASTVKENEHISSSSSFSVPAGGKIEVSGQRGSVVLYGAYEAFSSEDTDIHVEGITLSSETMTLKVGAQAVLTATVTPSNATNKTVVWSSSDTSVVTAAQTGKIKAVAEGAAIVTAVTEDGDFEARCVVYVTSDGSDPDDPTVPEIPIETEYPYEINSLSIVSESGTALETIALGTSFIIEAEITKTETRSSRDYIFAAVYDKDGALLCIDYVKASFAEDYDYAIGFHVPAQTKAIGSVKVFVWEGFNSEKPLSKSAEISFT